MEKWLQLQGANPEAAIQIEDVLLAVCETLQAQKTGEDKLAVFARDPVCQELKRLLDEHGELLGVRERSDLAYIEWILRHCFRAINIAEARS